jgi:predicted NBD/HSP70 family sugar kinase
LEAGEEQAQQIWETIGVYAGYAIAHYADFYQLKHVLLLGRVTSGRGGPIILEQAKRVLAAEFPELAEKIELHLPDEKTRRVGQAVAAASLPEA